MGKLNVGILGATGAAGIEFVRALSNHPWFEIAELYASERSAGKAFGEACEQDESNIPATLRNKKVMNISAASQGLDLLCSALPSDVAKDVEAQCAAHTPVISTTSAFRYENDVPILITEVNAEHCQLLEKQQKNRGWKGWIAPGPNCTTVGLVMSLLPIYRHFGVSRVFMASYQSVSGGGKELINDWKSQRKPELPMPLSVLEEPLASPELALDGNVIGYIKDEEDKVRRETMKILGCSDNSGIRTAGFGIDCSCARVPTLRGHFEAVFVETILPCSEAALRNAYASFNEQCRELFSSLPSSPKQAIVVLDRAPQPLFDVNLQGGMAAIVGRIEPNRAYVHGIKYQVLSNNTVKGAAKGMVQVAEYLHSTGFLRAKSAPF